MRIIRLFGFVILKDSRLKEICVHPLLTAETYGGKETCETCRSEFL